MILHQRHGLSMNKTTKTSIKRKEQSRFDLPQGGEAGKSVIRHFPPE